MPTITLSDGVGLHYEAWGDPGAPPVVLLHGLTGDHRAWAEVVGPLSEAYRAIAVDLRGAGKSGAPDDPTTATMARYAEDLRELLDALEIDICALAGCSFGGMVALQFATTWPERVAALIASDSSAAREHPAYDETMRGREARIEGMEALAARKGMHALAKQAAEGIRDPFLAAGVRAKYIERPLAGFLAACHARRTRPNLVPLLRGRLTMPVLLAWGERDELASAAAVMTAELPGARVLTFRGAGHGLPMVRGPEFARELLDFLETVEAGEPVTETRTVE
jgi:pimeloyl-ACP methyl ester carboxylesterase